MFEYLSIYLCFSFVYTSLCMFIYQETFLLFESVAAKIAFEPVLRRHQWDERTLKFNDFLNISFPVKLDDDIVCCVWHACIIFMLTSCIWWILQRYCRGFLFSHKHPQKHQSAVIIQAAIRRIIAQKQYNRLKFGVTDINNVLLYFKLLVIKFFI